MKKLIFTIYLIFMALIGSAPQDAQAQVGISIWVSPYSPYSYSGYSYRTYWPYWSYPTYRRSYSSYSSYSPYQSFENPNPRVYKALEIHGEEKKRDYYDGKLQAYLSGTESPPAPERPNQKAPLEEPGLEAPQIETVQPHPEL